MVLYTYAYRHDALALLNKSLLSQIVLKEIPALSIKPLLSQIPVPSNKALLSQISVPSNKALLSQICSLK